MKNKIINVIMALLIVIAILVVVSQFCFHWRYDAVMSGSMRPTLGVGGMIITRPVNTGDIREGDIITFSLEKKRITHRVIGISKDESGTIAFQTKGDHNEDPDRFPVTSRSGRGFYKLVGYVPYVGYIMAFAQTKWAFYSLIAAILILSIWLIFPIIKKGIQEEREKRKKAIPVPERVAAASSGKAANTLRVFYTKISDVFSRPRRKLAAQMKSTAERIVLSGRALERTLNSGKIAEPAMVFAEAVNVEPVAASKQPTASERLLSRREKINAIMDDYNKGVNIARTDYLTAANASNQRFEKSLSLSREKAAKDYARGVDPLTIRNNLRTNLNNAIIKRREEGWKNREKMIGSMSRLNSARRIAKLQIG